MMTGMAGVVGDVGRGVRVAVRRRPGTAAAAALAVLALSVLLPPVLLSVARKPADFFTFNPWLSRLPEYLVSDVPLAEKARKLPELALFWFSADSPYGGTEWGYAVDVGDVARLLLTAVLFGLYFALWRCRRDRRAAGPVAVATARSGGVAGAALSVVGLSTGPCSVMGCGAPVLPVVGLAFAGLSSGTLTFLSRASTLATAALLVGLVLAVGWLARDVGRHASPNRGSGRSIIHS